MKVTYAFDNTRVGTIFQYSLERYTERHQSVMWGTIDYH